MTPPQNVLASTLLSSASGAALPVFDCDVVVIGGGINGTGIARDLVCRGWQVTLCEQDDLASHT